MRYVIVFMNVRKAALIYSRSDAYVHICSFVVIPKNNERSEGLHLTLAVVSSKFGANYKFHPFFIEK